MAPTKKTTPRSLPPRPTTATTNKAAEAPKIKRSDTLKATKIRIDLEDGSSLAADGAHATDLYIYLMDCERHCAGHLGTVAPYLGPRFKRIDKDGTELST